MPHPVTTWLVVMTREFPDELLSAFLDNELSPAERLQVENHLAASPADRQLLAELKTLKGEVASLPAPPVRPDFADRVVQAALAAAHHNNARGVVVPASPASSRRRWNIGAAVAGVALLAASFLLAVFFGGQPTPSVPSDNPFPPLAVMSPAVPAAIPVAALPEQLFTALAPNVPGDREAVVLRLRAAQTVPLADALKNALAAAGLQPPARPLPSSAALLEEAYRSTFASQLSDAAIVPTQAVFVEAPYERLRGFADQLAAAVNDQLRLEACGKLPLGRAWDEDRAEGEAAAAPVVHHLNASVFKLQQVMAASTVSANPPPLADIEPQRRLRILILVEQ